MIAGLTPFKPAVVQLHSTRTSTAEADGYAIVTPVSGFASNGLMNVASRRFVLGRVEGISRPLLETVIPAGPSVILHINSFYGNELSLEFFQ